MDDLEYLSHVDHDVEPQSPTYLFAKYIEPPRIQRRIN